MKSTFMANAGNVTRKWYIVDAEGKTLGRLAAGVAEVLSGKNKPTFTPHVDTGDFVVIINADKVVLTGKKLLKKEYFHYTGYIGGDRYQKAGDALREKPVWVVEHAIRGMLPKTKLGDQMYRKLKVYAGSEHPHAAQQPEELKFDIRYPEGKEMKMAEATYYGTGRRKTSVARVRLVAGQGNIVINGRVLDDYFDLKTLEIIVKQPLELTGTTAVYDVIASVKGGGASGQAGAIRHGISRALLEVDPEYR